MILNSSYIVFSVCKVASQNLNKKHFGRDWRKPTIQAAQGGKGRGREGQHDAMIARFSYNIAFLEALSGIVAIIANGIDNQESTNVSLAPDWVGCRYIGAPFLSFRHSAKASTKMLNPCSEAENKGVDIKPMDDQFRFIKLDQAFSSRRERTSFTHACQYTDADLLL